LKKYLFVLYAFAFLPLSTLAQLFERSLNNEKWLFKNKKETNWLAAKVPGTIHTDLLNAKKIPNPFLNNNESKLQWIENQNWDYKTTFYLLKSEVVNENITLQFDGLDTDAKVFVNDSLVLTANNMFRTWTVNVKKYLHFGKNTMVIQFESSVVKAKAEAKKLNYTLPGNEQVFVRKAPYQFGWDWGPRYVTCGIWKAAKLKFWNKAQINHVQFIQKSLTKSLAQLAFNIQVFCTLSGFYKVAFQNTNLNPILFDTLIALQAGENFIKLPYQIYNPNLWWTHNLGKQNLYNYTFFISNEKQIIDSTNITFGLRTLEIIQENDTFGQSFFVKLNGIPVFIKGANYIPEDIFLPRVSALKTTQLIANAKAANMNMLRVWGGGVYASNEFYKLCNENGILVWQDFMFACAMYPDNEAFLANINEEANNQIIRLRNNPSLAIWCGNNEVDEGWKNWGWQKQFHYSTSDSVTIANSYYKIFEQMLKIAVNSLDKSRFYWPSSPSIGWGHKESLTQGDAHYWGVWWGLEPFNIYEKKVGRFMSEYGFQGMPSLQTFKNISALQLKNGIYKIDSVILLAHQKHPTGFKTIETYMERDYIIPKKFENYVYVSQLLQAKGLKTAIEAHRRAMPFCMGTLYWQLNDCWPVTSWSSVDYNGNWKALHYQVKQSYSDILISFEEVDDTVLVYIVSDKLVSIKGNLQIKMIDFEGKVLFVNSIETIIQPNNSKVYYRFSKSNLKLNVNFKRVVLAASFNNDKQVIQSVYYFVKPKDLILLKPDFLIKNLKNNKIEVISNRLAKNVYLHFKNQLIELDNNFFDLLPNEPKIIQLSNSFKSTDIQHLKIKTLFDAK